MQKIYTIEPIDALKIAIQSERELSIYYQKALQLPYEDDVRSILAGLGQHADEHHQRAIEMYSKFTGKKILFLNLDKRHKLNTLQRCSDEPNDAVRIAKKNEKEMADFYGTVCRRFLDAELRSFFRQLAAENHQHLALLEATFVEPLMLNQSAADGDVYSSYSEEHQESR